MKMNAEQILKMLDENGIAYTVREHRPIYTVAEGRALNIADVDAAAKSLFLTDDKQENFYLAVLPLDKKLDLKRLRAALNCRRLTMASAQNLAAILGANPGAVTPLNLIGNKYLIAVIFDAALQNETIAVPLNSNTQTIWLPCAALQNLLAQYHYEIQYLTL